MTEFQREVWKEGSTRKHRFHSETQFLPSHYGRFTQKDCPIRETGETFEGHWTEVQRTVGQTQKGHCECSHHPRIKGKEIRNFFKEAMAGAEDS